MSYPLSFSGGAGSGRDNNYDDVGVTVDNNDIEKLLHLQWPQIDHSNNRLIAMTLLLIF